MNHNQLPWCRCHNQKTLHYFFRETSPSLKTGKTRKQLMTACHECGSPGNQQVKKTPEMRRDWLESLPVLDMDAYYSLRYGWIDKPRPYTIGNRLNKMERLLHQHLARMRTDRRTEYGLWTLYEKDYDPNPFFGTPFREHWKNIKYGFLKFPAKLKADPWGLCQIGVRRAEHAKHPRTLKLIFANPDAKDLWYAPQFFYQRDIDTKRVSYLVCFVFNEDWAVKVELDLEHIMSPAVQAILNTSDEWKGQEIFQTPAEEIAEAENIESEYLEELKEDACAASGTGEFAIWHFDPELGADE